MYEDDSVTARLVGLLDKDPRTDAAIADALGTTKQAVSMWRHGKRIPNKTTIRAIAQMYDVNPSWLLYGDRYATVASVTGTPPTDLNTEELLLISVYRSASPDRRNRAIRVLTGQE